MGVRLGNVRYRYAHRLKATGHGRQMTSHPFLRLLGRVAGAIGLLRLLQDMQIASLRGLFHDWITAYAQFLNLLYRFFIQPIHLGSFIKHSEINVLLLAVLIFLAHRRAVVQAVGKSQRFKDNYYVDLVLASILIIAPIFVLVLVLPPMFSIIGSVLLLMSWIFLFTFTEDSADDRKELFPGRHLIRRELLTVMVYTAAIIGINYIFF